jgi:hypothetical protein
MKATIKDVASFKKLVGLASAMSNKMRSESVEGCIFFSVKKDRLYITSGSSGSHLCRLSMEVSSSDDGDFTVNAKVIESLTKAVNSDSLIISTSNEQVNFTIPTLGTVSEGLYIGDGLSKSLLEIKDKVSKYQIIGNSTLSPNLKVIGAFSSKSKSLMFKSGQEGLKIFGIGDLGYIAYADTGSFEEFTFFIDPSYLPLIGQMGEVISIGVENGVVEISSDDGNSIYLYDLGSSSDEYDNVDQILNISPSTSIDIKSKEMMSSLSWQSYGSNDVDTVEISVDTDNKLCIQGKGTKPSTLSPCKMNGSLTKVSLNTRSLVKSVSSVSKNTQIKLQQIQVPVGDDTVYITSFTNDESGKGYNCLTTLLFEQKI